MTVVSQPGQRVIARMLTGWDAAPCFNNLSGQRAIGFHDGEVPAPTASHSRNWLSGFSPFWACRQREAVSRGAGKSQVFLASF